VVAGDYAAARSGLPGGCPSPSNPNPATMAVCWPRPLGNTGQALAGRVGLDPNLPYAIMMAESGMRPEVTSPVGARGLMQLMPAVAARLEPDRRPDPDRLYSPGVNARLGILELSRLHTLFRGRLNGSSLPAVIAGYNGGPEAVERWLSASATPQEFDRWAEDISFTETRRYVKRVLGYLQTWRQVYGDPA
jgi:soluble lytic murein transglycosylase